MLTQPGPGAGSSGQLGEGGFCAEFKAQVNATEDHCVWAKDSAYQKGVLGYPASGLRRVLKGRLWSPWRLPELFSRGACVGTVPETHRLCWLKPLQRGRRREGERTVWDSYPAITFLSPGKSIFLGSLGSFRDERLQLWVSGKTKS